MARITDAQRKKIVALHAEGLSDRAIAREMGISAPTVKRAIDKEPDVTLQIFTRKQEENVQTMLDFMDGKREVAQLLIDDIMKAMGNPLTLKRAGVNQLAIALGVILDKYKLVDERGGASGGEAADDWKAAIVAISEKRAAQKAKGDSGD